MQFNSLDFMIFFPIVVGLYFIIPRKIKMYWLLVASYYFYMSWNAKYLLLIVASTIITFSSGVVLSKTASNELTKRKLVMVVSIISNLSLLALFKYGNFAIDILNKAFAVAGISLIDKRFDFLLPVGISFYTFQALGYMIDVYRGEIKAERNIVRYALFVSFFPQLVAGPIERSKNLLNQMRHIEEIKLWDVQRVTSGAILMVWGLFMKMVVADRVSILVDTIFGNYVMYGSVELILAALGFTIQIYCDFASYSMIAIGAAKIMGFNLMENFNTPYFSRSIREFWGRWHISLSTWFRDYLYIPLGGNRKGIKRKYINIMIVFLVSGLWHGAGLSFVVWGGIHGLYLVLGDALKPCKSELVQKFRIKTDCFSWRLLQTLITFTLVAFAWIFFRADSLFHALRYIKRIVVHPTPWVLFNDSLYNLGLDRTELAVLAISLLILFLVDIVRFKEGVTIDAFLFTQNAWFEWAVIIIIVVMIFVFGEYGPTFDAKQFIYFQF